MNLSFSTSFKDEVTDAIKNTTLKMSTIQNKLEMVVNRKVISLAKKNYKAGGHQDNPAIYKGRTMPSILKDFKTGRVKNKKVGGTYISVGTQGKKGEDRAFHATFIEKGAYITPKRGKRLFFLIGGELKSAYSTEITAQPFLTPAFDEYWGTGKAEEIMRAQLQKELEKYWKKKGNS